jgi:MOSC domain-containing protein YiiM
MTPTVVAVSKSSAHTFSKFPCESIELLAGLGAKGDAHLGETVKHRSRVKADPTEPNLRQLHLLHEELLDALRDRGFDVQHGSIGENITTRGIDLLALPRRTRLLIGQRAVVEITGLRNPCKQLDDYQNGLLNAVLERRGDGTLIRKAGVMGIVVVDGVIKPGDEIHVTLPAQPHEKLDRV